MATCTVSSLCRPRAHLRRVKMQVSCTAARAAPSFSAMPMYIRANSAIGPPTSLTTKRLHFALALMTSTKSTSGSRACTAMGSRAPSRMRSARLFCVCVLCQIQIHPSTSPAILPLLLRVVILPNTRSALALSWSEIYGFVTSRQRSKRQCAASPSARACCATLVEYIELIKTNRTSYMRTS